MKIDNEVLRVLSNAGTNGNALVIHERLDRKLYEKANKVLDAAGGKWNRKARAHLFDGDAAAAIEQVLLSGEITRPQNFDYFPTPEPIVAHLLELARIETGMTVLEPSAGQGAIAREAAAITRVDCVELQIKNVEILHAQNFSRVILHEDFLQLTPRPVYDRVVMNPPFGKQVDILPVLHALAFLKPGGLLVSVMSVGITFRTNKPTADFRALLERRGGTIEDCPDESFKSVGTRVRTVIVTIPAGMRQYQ